MSFNLERFVEAQDRVWPAVLAELRAGRKTSHWMWFVFPQIAGLGRSPASVKYALSGPDEASAYLEHPVLGARLRECAQILLGLSGLSAFDIFGGIDDQKLQSSLTLFTLADPAESLFRQALHKYFGGRLDQATLTRAEH